MHPLDCEHDDLDRLLKGTLKTNEVLDEIMRHPQYQRTMKKLRIAIKSQIKQLLKEGLLDDIQSRIGKETQNIWTESDELEVQDAVVARMEPLDKKFDPALMTAFLVWVFNRGGQHFFNQQSIPHDFNLTNQDIISGIQNHSVRLFKGLDETTSKWVSDQIVYGKQNSLSNSDISQMISDDLPDVSQSRAERIVRTESSNMIGEAENIAAVRNGADRKMWVTVGGACDICDDNEAAGDIGINQPFPSGDQQQPAHPNCRCIVNYMFTPFQGTIWDGK